MINSDDRIGWGGFLPFWYKSIIHFTIVHTGSVYIRQSLWDFFRAAFPQVTYCLASATLTDDAVKDIQSRHHFITLISHIIDSITFLRVTGHSEGADEDSLQVTT